jgi:hypothetical protein
MVGALELLNLRSELDDVISKLLDIVPELGKTGLHLGQKVFQN